MYWHKWKEIYTFQGKRDIYHGLYGIVDVVGDPLSLSMGELALWCCGFALISTWGQDLRVLGTTSRGIQAIP